jgi:hypothetical protein
VRGTPGPLPLTLKPGEIATTLLSWTPNPPDQPDGNCSAFPGDISVILPDDTNWFDIDVLAQNLPQVCDSRTVCGGAYQPS